MIKDVNVTIDLEKPIGSVGFGFPLILNAVTGEGATAIPYTECNGLSEIITALGDNYTDSPIYQAAALLYSQDNAPETVAIMQTTGTEVAALPSIIGNDWRQLIVCSTTASVIKAVSDYIEGIDEKMFFTSVASSTAAAAVGTNERTVCVVYASTDVTKPEAALVGATAGKPAGSFTYKNIALSGVTAQTFTSTEVTAIHNAGAITFLEKCKQIVTSDGITMSGEFADIVDSEDYIVQQIEYQTQLLLIQEDKIPYTNTGIAMLENVCVNVLKDAANNGMIATNDDGDFEYTVNYLGRSYTEESDRANRKYIEGNFTFALAGAIHTVQINGTITI